MKIMKKSNREMAAFQPLEPEISLDDMLENATETTQVMDCQMEVFEDIIEDTSTFGFVAEPLSEKDMQEEKIDEKKEGKTMTLKEKLKKLHQENDDMVQRLEEKLLHIVSTTNATEAVLDFPIHKQEVVASYLKENDLSFSMNVNEDVATFTIAC